MTYGITKRIGSIKFSCLSPEEIRKMSAIKVITPDTYDEEGFPFQGGLMDPHMGVIEPGLRCKTCGCKVDECPGHFGHIELARPVIHVGFIKDIKMLLESTCCKCGRLMLPSKEIQKCMERMEELGGDIIDIKLFIKAIAKDASVKNSCPYCGETQIKIKLDKPTTFRGTDDNHKLTPQEVRDRLENIPDEDLRALGIDPETCRPEWMVLTVLAVPPVSVRPSITLEAGEKSEDDLTHKLVDIIRINQRLRENRDAGVPQPIVEDLWELLQYHVTTYFDNQTSGIPPARHRSGRPLKTLEQRLKGKEGRFRSNLSGKRVNFSARTVISPDPLLSINEVGVPTFAARELTVPLRVNENNIEKVREIVSRGSNFEKFNFPYQPGAKYVIRPDGRRIRVTERNAMEVAENLTVGCTVERQLVDGDVVLFNRQPSLHRMSMMAHRVRVMEGKTFRFNPCVCPPYNADFDGDEMNLHVLQSDEARAEARIIMQVQENILSPRYGGPIIGAIQDYITGAYFLTHNNPSFSEEEASDIMFRLNDIKMPEPFMNEKNQSYWTGKQLFSTVLPKDFNASFKANICQNCNSGCKKDQCEYDAYVKIRDGKLVCGTIDVKAIGNSKGKILDRIARDYGSARAAQFINQVTRLSLGALMNHGFSINILDSKVSDFNKRRIKTFIRKYQSIIEEIDSDEIAFDKTKDTKIKQETANLMLIVDYIVRSSLREDNSEIVMVDCGARSSIHNLRMIYGCVGQQYIRGKRIDQRFTCRTLSTFQKDENNIESMGFCINSFKDGLTPTEFFFHAMGGREALVDTAIRTSRSGYMQRRLVSALEDLKLTSDGTIRNTVGTVVQFRYGEDGVDPAKTVRGKAIDLDDLFFDVFGEESENYDHDNEKDVGDNYGMLEKDEMEYYCSDYENEESIDDEIDYNECDYDIADELDHQDFNSR